MGPSLPSGRPEETEKHIPITIYIHCICVINNDKW